MFQLREGHPAAKRSGGHLSLLSRIFVLSHSESACAQTLAGNELQLQLATLERRRAVFSSAGARERMVTGSAVPYSSYRNLCQLLFAGGRLIPAKFLLRLRIIYYAACFGDFHYPGGRLHSYM